MREISDDGKSRLYIIAAVLLTSPFFLNDFASIYVKKWQLWLFIDYVSVKLFPLAIAFWLIYSKKMDAAAFGLKPQPLITGVVVFFVVGLVGTVIDQNAYRLLEKLPGYPPLGGMPEIQSAVWNWVDLTIGLLLVGICEELVFRGYLHTFISRYTENVYVIVIVSSAAFGLIHWSLGLHAVLITATVGAILMIAYLMTRSLPAIMLAHFAINFIDFSGVIPKAVFKFL